MKSVMAYSNHHKTLCLCLLLWESSHAFTIPKVSTSRVITKTRTAKPLQLVRSNIHTATLLYSTPDSTTTTTTIQAEKEFDKLLDETRLREATKLFQTKSDLIDMTRERWNRVFDAIEQITADAEEESINKRNEQSNEAFPLLSKSRMEMTDMYDTLKDFGHLRLFGSINRDNMPASGSHAVRPSMLEQISNLSMKALTPKPSNVLLYAGFVLAMLEGLGSIYLGLNLNLLFFVTVAAALADRILINGALSETAAKILNRETQPRINRHEAGHFLCAYLLGCPVEGYVLSAWAALQDARFGSRGVGAGTSFFDPKLSSDISSSKVTRSSIDRYSIIVMAGIAAEAVNYNRADGGAGDEMALISFLSNLNGAPSANSFPAWNDVTIRNQARWGALQAVLLIREYRECYDALVDALERGGSLGDCIYAIEKAGRDSGKLGLEKPLGYIIEKSGDEEEWVTKLPSAETDESNKSPVAAAAATTLNNNNNSINKPAAVDPEDSLETLRQYKQMVEAKLKDIDAQLDDL